MMTDLSRGAVIKATGAVGAAMLPVGLSTHQSAAQDHSHDLNPAVPPASPRAQSTTYLFFNANEAAFIEAAVERLIPPDDKWAGALQAGVPNYSKYLKLPGPLVQA